MKNYGIRAGVTAVAASALFVSASWADLADYSQDFEGLDSTSPSALGDDGWLVGANVFDSNGVYLFNYFAFPAPNGSGSFSNVAVGAGGVDQGDQQMVVFNDYNNTEQHNTTNIIEANVFHEQNIGAADIGSTWTFSFDAALGDIADRSTALAFIKTLDPNNNWNTSNFLPVDMTTIPSAWNPYTIDILITADLSGQIMQFGFLNTASEFEPSGILYDNVSFVGDGLPVELIEFNVE
jgi:hypothetical protein